MIKLLVKKMQLDPTELVNYRPISNLPFLSKILEKAVSSQLCSFLERNDICEYLDRTIVLRLLSSESQMICSYHPIVVVSLH